MSLDRKGKTMKHKRSLIFVLCGMLLTPSLPVDTMAMTSDADIIRVESVLVKTRGNTVSKSSMEEAKEEIEVLAVKEKKTSKTKKKKNKKSRKNKKKKNNKKKNIKKKNNKKKNNKKKNKKRTNRNNKREINKKQKNKNMNESKDIKLKEEDVNKLPETDKYKPEIKNNDFNWGNLGTVGGNKPPVREDKENLSTAFTLFCTSTDKLGKLRFKAGQPINLPERAYIGFKSNGENTGEEIGIDWSGEDIAAIKTGVKGNYSLAAYPKENIVIDGKDYGRVKFLADIIVE